MPGVQVARRRLQGEDEDEEVLIAVQPLNPQVREVVGVLELLPRERGETGKHLPDLILSVTIIGSCSFPGLLPWEKEAFRKLVFSYLCKKREVPKLIYVYST